MKYQILIGDGIGVILAEYAGVYNVLLKWNKIMKQ